ncbi:MAG: heme o synthase, partial [Patescibacteria group bacterium]|nr:heme o synthase [Patescibacteria group bacterium]
MTKGSRQVQAIKTYYLLTKPGIIYGNTITTVAGFLLASQGKIYFGLFMATLFGVSFVIASACVINNYLDRKIDKKMARTQKRALVTHAISPSHALVFATILGILGFLDLVVFTNGITFMIGLIGYIDYIVLYGLSKRKSIYGTLVGSISGATPIAAGYTAVTNRFDIAALLLFLIMVFWQMPHFYAIAIYRLKDYVAAGIPVLPAKKSM